MNWGVFVAVLVGLLLLALIGAALADRRARARGYRLNPALARSLRQRRGMRHETRAGELFGRHPGERPDRR